MDSKLPHVLMPRVIARSRGFTYLVLLFVIALTAASASAAATYWHIEKRRDAEQELIRIGEEFRAAIRSYYHASTGTVKTFPPSLDDLILDRRYLGIKRHLRKLYVDPMTGRAEWGLVRAPDGGVMGVHSLANQAATKRLLASSTPQPAEPNTYGRWLFVYSPDDSNNELSVRPIGLAGPRVR